VVRFKSAVRVCTVRSRIAGLALLAAAVIAGAEFTLDTGAAFAQDATWAGPGNLWTTGGNWSPAAVPTGTATFSGAAPTSIRITAGATINEMLFTSSASAYSFAISGFATFEIQGTGVVNNSASVQTFNVSNGFLFFENSSTAANAAINNSTVLEFQNSSTAASAAIKNQGGTLYFADQSTGGNATVTNAIGGSAILFFDNATGGNARFVNTFGATVDFSLSSGPSGNNALAAGSIEGGGNFYLGGNQITVGGNNLSTTVAGNISDCGTGGVACQNAGATGGSLVKVGTGTLTLTAPNSYTGGTTISGGTLQLSADGTLGATTATTTITTGGTLDLGGTSAAPLTQASLNLSGGTLQDGRLNAPITSTGGTINGISGSASLTTTSGTTTVTGSNTFTGGTNVNGGTLTVNGTLSDPTVNGGGLLNGIGSVGATQVNAGGTFAPGNGTPGTSLTVNGSLALVSGATYQIYLSPTATSFATVNGAATLGGTVQANFAAGSYVSKTYTILIATGGVSGAFSGVTNVSLPSGASDSLSYDANDVYLNVKAGFSNYTGLNTNQHNLANTLTSYFNTNGGIPAQFFGLTASGLSQIDGEASTGAERAAFQLMNQFLGIMLDPFVDGRFGGYGNGSPAIGFAADGKQFLPPDVALAYASILGKDPAPQDFAQRWTAWGSAYGGASNTNGNAAVGSNNLNASTFGFAAGADYHLSSDTIVGFALGGGGTGWGLTTGGTGRSDAFQSGAYGITRLGPAYLAGALAFANNWFTTNRSAFGNGLTATFAGQSYGARVESGYRYAALPTLGVTPYAAVQAQDFSTPNYSETNVVGGGLGLTYAAMNATDVRTEVGSRLDSPQVIAGMPLVLRGRIAWAHDFVNNPALSASFQSLPGTGFIVNGAPIPRDSALTTAGAELFIAPNWTLLAKFDGEFASGSQTYAGSGTLRYTW
jgi:autotransporter-associated beta strand protein